MYEVKTRVLDIKPKQGIGSDKTFFEVYFAYPNYKFISDIDI